MVKYYKANKQTNIFRVTPGKLNVFGDTASITVGKLEQGQIFKVIKTGSGGRGIVATPYLYLTEEDYIIGWDASELTEENRKEEERKTENVFNNNKITPTYIKVMLALLVALVLFLIYKHRTK